MHLGCVSVSDTMMVKVFDQDYGSSDDLLIETSWSGWATAVSGQTETLHDERHTDDDEWAATK